MGENKLYYTTGEFANIFGINKRTLFYYHEVGLFKPNIVCENGYRYYSFRQMETFFIITILRKMNISLKDIKLYLDNRSKESFIELAKSRIKVLEFEIKKLKNVHKILYSMLNDVERGIKIKMDDIIIKFEKEEKLYLIPLYENKNKEFNFEKYINNSVLEYSFFSGAILKEKVIKEKKFTNYMSFFNKFYFYNINENDYLIKKEGNYIITYHRGSYDTIHMTYKKIENFLNENNLKIIEFVYENYLISEISEEGEENFVTEISGLVDYI